LDIPLYTNIKDKVSEHTLDTSDLLLSRSLEFSKLYLFH
jgi:hypothetical protein